MPRLFLPRAAAPALAAALILACAPAAAQTLELTPPPPDAPRLSLGFQHPNLDEFRDELSFASGAFELSLAVPLTERFVLLWKIPYSRTSLDYTIPDWWDGPPPPELANLDGSALGNTFLGLQSRPGPGPKRTWTTFGLHLPTADDEEGIFAGAAADITRPERFSPETMTLVGKYHWRHDAPEVSMQGTVGLNLFMVMLDDYPGDSGEMYLSYGQAVSVPLGAGLHAVGEFTGMMVVTEQPDEFSDRFMNNIALGLGWRAGRVSPTVYYRWPLNDNVSTVTNSVLGLRLDVALPGGD